jgi:hypothetical protein
MFGLPGYKLGVPGEKSLLVNFPKPYYTLWLTSISHPFSSYQEAFKYLWPLHGYHEVVIPDGGMVQRKFLTTYCATNIGWDVLLQAPPQPLWFASDVNLSIWMFLIRRNSGLLMVTYGVVSCNSIVVKLFLFNPLTTYRHVRGNPRHTAETRPTPAGPIRWRY